MNITERFLKYVSFDTQSAEVEGKCPSTSGQFKFAEFLKQEMIDEGLEDVVLDENGYLYATLPANIENAESVPVVGFIAHMDTSPDCSGKDVRPQIIRNYQGGDIVLDAAENIVTRVSMFPELRDHIGEDLIVTDGHTLLGADDKAGIAEIMQAMRYLQDHPEIKHGKIRVAFNPDEEIGMGAHLFDVERFGCAWAYTMDGSEVGELEFENFNAASAKIQFTGRSVHPGYAKGKMINAIFQATRFADSLPEERPETTEGYEGFYHLMSCEGSVEQASLSYIIRDHDRKRFEERKQWLVDAVKRLNEQMGEEVATIEVKDSYYNMREVVEPQMHIIDIAKTAIEHSGVPCQIKAIRGGTDGAQLSFKGLPCPNIFAGGLNFHGPHEFLPIPSMERAMKVIVNICAAVPQPKLAEVRQEQRSWLKKLGVSTVKQLAEACEKGYSNHLVMLAEALQEKKIASIAEKIAASKSKLVLVSGPSSSGKTTFSMRLCVQLVCEGLRPIQVSMDDYFLNRENTPRDANGNYDFESVYAVDIEYFQHQLQQLLSGEEIELPRFNFKTGQREASGKRVLLGAKDVLVVEGIHALNPLMTQSVDDSIKFKVFASALTAIMLDDKHEISGDDNRLLRRMLRDAAQRGRTAEETLAAWPSVHAGEKKWILPFAETADAMFNSAMLYEIAVLRPYVEPVLSKVEPASPQYAEAQRLLTLVQHAPVIPTNQIPTVSLMREFVGGSMFKY